MNGAQNVVVGKDLVKAQVLDSSAECPDRRGIALELYLGVRDANVHEQQFSIWPMGRLLESSGGASRLARVKDASGQDSRSSLWQLCGTDTAGGSPQEEQGELVPGEPLLDEVTPVFNGLRVCFSVHSRVRDQPLV
jgi:hypothetical protein